VKALLYEKFGGPEVLQHTSVPDPEPGPRDVIVEVVATALNHLDVVQRSGAYALPMFELPHIAGMDVVGTVVSVGSEADATLIGRRVVVDPSLAGAPDGSKLAGMGDLYFGLGVIGATVAGGYAELCLVPETHVHSIPDAMSWHQAVAFPTTWLTAHHALFDSGHLTFGETVMIHAAGSGVSTAAIQLAVHAGATVLATAGTDEKCAKALELGASHVANNRTEDITAWAREVTGGVGVDMVFDHVGPALWAASMFALKPRGRLVNCGNTTGDTATIPSLGQLFHNGTTIIGSDAYRPEEFPVAWAQYTSGAFHSPIDSVFPLSAGAEAQQKLLANDVFGKIVLDVSRDAG
jgi:NADPH:quinone reductase-like Zn-dependent oxidoreductase